MPRTPALTRTSWFAPMALAALLATSAPLAASEPGVVPTDSARPAPPRERAELIRGFVRRWGPHVERTYGIDVQVWAQRMVPTFAHGDPTNLRRAAVNPSFEAALRDLSGVGHRAPAARPAARASANPDIGKALGDGTRDLVYTPITPCRIVDTRMAGGPIGAGQTRDFVAWARTDFTAQGGTTGTCGLSTPGIAAVAMNVTAVVPQEAGFATVYAYNTSRPGTASVNYAAGQIVNNAIIGRIPNPADAFDFTLYTHASAHYVVDVVGFFAAPVATAIQCIDTADTAITIAPGTTGQVTPASCPLGYTAVHINCETGSWFSPVAYATLKSGGVCGARNTGSTNAVLTSSRRCCRIPGR